MVFCEKTKHLLHCSVNKEKKKSNITTFLIRLYKLMKYGADPQERLYLLASWLFSSVYKLVDSLLSVHSK